MKCFVLCIVFVTLCGDAYGNYSGDMAKTIQVCCDEGYEHARKHTVEDCQGTLPITAGLPQYFVSMCEMAKTHCCSEYFQKKSDCDTGVDISISTNSCKVIQGISKICCDDCVKGTALGASEGPDACAKKKKSPEVLNAEEMITNEAFMKCCMEASKGWKEEKSDKKNNVTLTVLPSTCELFAPNELCAHHCIPVPGSYKCQCNPGFMLMADGRNCKQVTKNRCKPRNHCQHKCNDNGVEVKCSCRRGYELMRDGKSCQDIDECQLDMPVCLPGTICHNTKGSYKCLPNNNKKKNNKGEKGQCPAGYKRNAISNVCDDINECALPSPPCPLHKCENTMGGYRCGGVSVDPAHSSHNLDPAEERCPTGFKIGNDGECEDVDECETRAHECNLLSQFCINTHSSFYCQDKASKYCPPGFKIDAATNKCEDINECEEDPDVCRLDQICINQRGKYDCKQKVEPTSATACPEGLRKKNGSNYCEDIDECAERLHICDAHQSCLNTYGSYDCHCHPGYELDITTGACVDLNECATGQHTCLPQAQRCDNTVGSYLCIRITPCGTGYVLQHSTGECEDIDECALGTHNCGVEYSCYNMRGSFRCVRRRPSTTTTTATPLYDDEYYYDSVEETDNTANNTNNKIPSEILPTSFSTTAKEQLPVQKPTEPTIDTHFEKEIDKDIKESPTTDIHYSEPKNSDLSETSPTLVVIPQPELPQKPSEQQPPQEPKESLPKPTEIQSIPTESQPTLTQIIPDPTEPNVVQPTTTVESELYPTETRAVPTEKQNADSEVKPTEWLPYQPRQFEFKPTESQSPAMKPYIPPEIPDDELPKEPEIPTTSTFKPEINNNFKPQGPESNLIPSPVPTTVPTSPDTFISVKVDKEPATDIETNKVDTDGEKIEKNDDKTNKPKDCPLGFEPDEYGSCFDIDECSTNRHSCSGLTEVCRNTLGGYTCSCAPGFRRHWVTKACDLIITTSSTTTTTTPLPTLPTTSTKSLFWGYPEYRVTTRPFRPRNLCDGGYRYNANTFQCEDINECTNGQANCASVEICVNTEGGYKCECPPNWRLDEIRHRCVPNSYYGHHIPPGFGNEPTSPTPPLKADIPISPGTKYVNPEITNIEDHGSVFKCPRGYMLDTDNICTDINECITGEAKCGPLQICTNLPGGYSCNCLSGYKLIGDHECEDVNECTVAGNLPVCSQNADCVNTMGSYQCKCHTGFRSAPVNDKVCVDVDECTESRPGTLCEHRCNNVWGGYRCSCHRGYKLNIDNKTCSDIDECEVFKSKVPCIGRCLNEPGSYRCSCPGGYKLSEDKRSCIDIDECETGEALCSKNSFSTSSSYDVCINTRGSYKCHHITCPVGYQLENKHRCTKVERTCQPADWNCTRQPTTISYNFITFVSNLYIPDGELKLFTMKGPAWANAKMRFELRLKNVNAPPSVKKKADINDFLLSQKTNFEGLMSLVRPLEGPQSIELDMSMNVYTDEQFDGTAVAKLIIYVSEYEF